MIFILLLEFNEFWQHLFASQLKALELIRETRDVACVKYLIKSLSLAYYFLFDFSISYALLSREILESETCIKKV